MLVATTDRLRGKKGSSARRRTEAEARRKDYFAPPAGPGRRSRWMLISVFPTHPLEVGQQERPSRGLLHGDEQAGVV
jgi:hypothetical protein